MAVTISWAGSEAQLSRHPVFTKTHVSMRHPPSLTPCEFSNADGMKGTMIAGTIILYGISPVKRDVATDGRISTCVSFWRATDTLGSRLTVLVRSGHFSLLSARRRIKCITLSFRVTASLKVEHWCLAVRMREGRFHLMPTCFVRSEKGMPGRPVLLRHNCRAPLENKTGGYAWCKPKQFQPGSPWSVEGLVGLASGSPIFYA